MELNKTYIEKLLNASTVDEALKQAREDGYDGGRKQLITALLDAGWKSGQLSEEELSFVAGGNIDLHGCCSSPCSNGQKCRW